MHSEQLATVMQTIADTLLSVPVERVRRLDALRFGDDALVAVIEYTHGFRGELCATFSVPLARALAGNMLGCSGASCTLADLEDAIGELANIAAGNVRGLLSAACQLSLPKVRAFADPSPHADAPFMARAGFTIFGQPMLATLRGVST